MNWKNQMIQARDGFPLYTRQIGEGSPLFLIHGSVVDGEFFREFGEILAKDYHVITYDRRGYGYSRNNPEEDKKDVSLYPGISTGEEFFRKQAEDAYCVMKEYTDEPAFILGCSAGAIIGMHLAIQHQESIRQIFFHEPPAYSLMPDHTEVWEVIDKIKESIRNRKYNSALNRFLLFITASREAKKELTQHEIDFFMNNGLNFVRNEYLMTFSSNVIPEKLPEGVQAVLLCGQETGDAPLGIAAERVAARFHLDLVKMPGSHNGARDDSEEFAQRFRDFLS